MSHLENYLGRLLEEGRLDSGGRQFQLDLLQQAAKMAAYQAEEPALWILKCIQAAVAAGAPQVRVVLTRTFLRVGFETDLDLDFGVAGWSQHLKVALQAAAAQQPVALRLQHHERQILGHGECPPEKRKGETILYFGRPGRPWLRLWDRQLGEILASLGGRCAFCPIPVKVDGRQINQPAPERCRSLESQPVKADWGGSSSSYRWLGERTWFTESTRASFALSCPALRAPAEVWTKVAVRKNPAAASGKRGSVVLFLSSLAPVQENQIAPQDLKLPHRDGSVRKGTLAEGAALAVDPSKFLMLGLDAEVLEERFGGPGWYLSRVCFVREEVTPVRELGQVVPVSVAAGRCQQWLGLSAGPKNRGGLYYVKDGILLNPVQLPFCEPGTMALVADPEVNTDLGQLTVVEDDRVRAQIVHLEREEKQLLRDCSPFFLSQQQAERYQIPLSMRQRWRDLRSKMLSE